jgi:hypothetical protein
MSGADLYALNPATRLNPGTGRPDYSGPLQPVRNGEAANVALKLLGLGPVPGSTIDSAQNLALSIPPPENFRVFSIGTNAALAFTTATNVLYDLQTCNDLKSGSWTNLTTNIIGNGGMITNIDTKAAACSNRFYRLRLHF